MTTWILGRQGKQQSEDDVTGGRQLTDNPKDVARMLKKDGKASDILIGDLPIIKDSEIQNFCSTGQSVPVSLKSFAGWLTMPVSAATWW